MAANNEMKHNSAVMQKVYKFYNEEKFTDVLFEFPFNSYSFTAHRLILSAASPYLLELFDNIEPDCSSVKITNIDSDTFEQLVLYCYNGNPDISAGNAERMLRGALLLRLDGVIDVCIDYIMDHIDDFLVRKLIALDAEIKCKPLETRLLDYIAKHFKTLNENGEIFGITAEQWKVIIDKVDAFDITQVNLFWAIKRWYEYNITTRPEKLSDVIGSLDLTKFDTDFILNYIKPLPGCERLANEAIKKQADMITCLAIQNWDEQWTGPKYILRYNQAEEEWVKTVSLEIKRYGFGTAFIGDTLYFMGGQSTFGIISEVQSYNLRTKELSSKPRMKERRTIPCVAVLGQYIYVIGGTDNKQNALKSVERYDTTTNRWEYVASMSSPRSSAGVAVYNGEIYIIGGQKDGYSLYTVECYNPTTNKWRDCKPTLRTRVGATAAVHREQIYVMGRQSGDLITVERYDPKRNEWNLIASLNVPRRYMCAASIGNQLVVFGGIVGPGKMDDTVEIYDMPNDKWLVKQKLPVTGVFRSLAVPTNLAENL